MVRGICVMSVAALTSLIGCRQILGLDSPSSADAGSALGSDSGNSNGDQDGDGVPDGADNCPTIANADQADYDGDGHGDVCDHCPHLPSMDDPDADGDGVGDACDPRPGMTDQRVYWTAFRDPDEIASWTHTGTWTAGMGTLVEAASGADVDIRLPIMVNRPYVATAVAAGAGGGSVLAYGIELVGTTNYACGLLVGTTPDVFGDSDGKLGTAPWSDATTGIQVAITEDVGSGMHDCEVTYNADTVGLKQALGTTTSTIVGMFTDGMPVAYPYLFVVETSP